MTLNIAVCLMCGICYDSGFGGFRTDLPNGERVSHPCKPNTFWQGVGHRNAAGGGSRNPFGIDFDNHGKQWTRELCMKDSDGDGKTNGYELGDPDCEWVKGEIPKRTEDITHPGVCTPFYDFRCQAENDWVDCKKEEFVCPALSRPGQIPDGPYECSIGAGYNCRALLGGWTLGNAGECLNENFGMLFGHRKFKKIAMEEDVYNWLKLHYRSKQSSLNHDPVRRSMATNLCLQLS